MHFDLDILRLAGRRRAREADDFRADFLHEFDGKNVTEMVTLLKRMRGELPPMAGGAPGQFTIGLSIGAITAAASPGAALLNPLVPPAEVPLALALGYLDAVVWTAAAESSNFAYGSTAGTAIAGATLYRSRVPVRSAIQTPEVCIDQVPLAAFNTYNWYTLVAASAAGATIATTNAAFAIVGFA